MYYETPQRKIRTLTRLDSVDWSRVTTPEPGMVSTLAWHGNEDDLAMLRPHQPDVDLSSASVVICDGIAMPGKRTNYPESLGATTRFRLALNWE